MSKFNGCTRTIDGSPSVNYSSYRKLNCNSIRLVSINLLWPKNQIVSLGNSSDGKQRIKFDGRLLASEIANCGIF